MSRLAIIVERASDWPQEWPHLPVVTAEEYLVGGQCPANQRLRVINLCHAGRYLSLGYYCSLLAEARNHRVIPSVRILQDLHKREFYGHLVQALNHDLTTTLARVLPATDRHSLLIAFGRCSDPLLSEIARRAFIVLPAPLLRLNLTCLRDKWRVKTVDTPNFTKLNAEEQALFINALELHLSRQWRSASRRRPARYDLAILHDPDEVMPPSDTKAITRFQSAAKSLGLATELITRNDIGRLAQFDALFIRATTAIDHYTYRFAQRAEAEGLVVIDDPASILRCTNKVYLKDLLDAQHVRTPHTVIIQRGGLHEAESALGYPMVIKIPDGSFSRGVYKVANRSELAQIARQMFRHSALLLTQEYLYTPFDWRVGILDGQPLYVCRYYMSRNHWQIIDHGKPGHPREGGFETLTLAAAPSNVIKTALRAARPIGTGLYGVDLKEPPTGVVVIEVNDNPSIDAGVEDKVLGTDLYKALMQVFLDRLEARGRKLNRLSAQP